MKRARAALLFAFMTAAAFCQGGGDFVHPGFSLGPRDLEKAVRGLSSGARNRIFEAPARFLDLVAGTLDQPQDLLILVDKSNGLAPDNIPEDLVPLSDPSLTLWKKGLSLRALLIPDLREMSRAARGEGITLPLSSAYRSYEYQAALYRKALETGSREEVERELAPPGHSQHQLGTAMDFGMIEPGFADTPAGKWLAAHAWKFGFSLSYPKGGEEETGYAYEPWHYRYVGVSAAAIIRDFFEGNQQRFLRYYGEYRTYFREKRR